MKSEIFQLARYLRKTTVFGLRYLRFKIMQSRSNIWALLGALATGVFRSALDTHVARLQVPVEIRVALDAEVPKLAEAKVPPQVVGEQRRALEEDLNEAFVRSFRVMLVAAGFALTSALRAFLTVGPHHKTPDNRGKTSSLWHSLLSACLYARP